MPNDFSPDLVPPNISFEQMNAIIAFRTLWLEQILWTRDFIYSIVDNHPNQAAITNRLFTGVSLNFYNALTVFYGRQIAEEFVQYQSAQILRIWRLVDAVKNNQNELVAEIVKDIYKGADTMAAFLASINSHWSRGVWNNFFIHYISMLNELIVSIVGGNYENEIRIFDRIQNLTILMGNYMASGILQSNLQQQAEPEPANPDQ